MRLAGAACAAAALAVLTPLASLAAAVPAPAAAASAAVTAPADGNGCKGVTLAVFPAQGFITDSGRAEGGHLWWRDTGTGTCIGTVIEDVQYNAAAAKTWRVIIYDTQFPGGDTVARQVITSGPGVTSGQFGIHQVFTGLTSVCITADDAFGTSCISFGPTPPQQQFAQSSVPAQPPASVSPPAPPGGQQSFWASLFYETSP